MLADTRTAAGITNVHLPPIHLEEDNIKVIIEMKQPYDSEDIYSLLDELNSVKVRKVFNKAINGFSAEGKRKDIEQLGISAYIESVSEIKEYEVTLNESVPFIGGEEIRGFYDIQNRRLTGKGVKVGVIDTGIDYHHPDLERAYKGGADLVDEDKDPMETIGSPEDSTFHGTHVAGIIAANGKVRGIAPEAEIYAYRALGPGGNGNTETVLKAVEKAIEDQVDILNLSLGNSINGPDLPISKALNKAVEQGITAVVSTGNSGPEAWTVGSPGTSLKAISVGASTPPVTTPFLRVGLGSKWKDIELQPVFQTESWNFQSYENICDAGKGNMEELKNAKGKIALIERGSLSVTKKIRNAAASGAVGVILYNNSNRPFIAGATQKYNIPGVTISKDDGLFIKDFLKKSSIHTVKTVYVKSKDKLARFSSRGPVTINWEIKPDLVAPGVTITSTVPGGYLSLHGTSMAAPHVAGAAALLKQAHPEWVPEQIKSALMSTAKRLKNVETKQYYKTYEQGAGRIRVEKAVQADTFFYPSSITFGLFERTTGDFKQEKKLVIENGSDEQRDYSFVIPKDEPGLTWELPFSFTLGPKEKKSIDIGLSIDSKRLKKGIYDGYIGVKEGANLMHIPYLYIKDKPNYPPIMGFYFGEGDQEEMYRYEMYIPREADELAVALYDYDTFRFIGYLDYSSPSPVGMVQKDIPKESIPAPGTYRIVIFLKDGKNREEFMQTIEVEK